MNDEKLEKELAKLGSEAAGAPWLSSADFKKEFWRKAKAQDARKALWRELSLGIAAALALCLVVAGALLAGGKRQQAPAAAALEKAALGSGDLAKMRETVKLFGENEGVAYLGDELITFERTEPLKPDRILALNLVPGRTIELAVGSNDYFTLDSPLLKGNILLAKTDGGDQVACFDLTAGWRRYESSLAFKDGIVLQDGRKLAEWRKL